MVAHDLRVQLECGLAHGKSAVGVRRDFMAAMDDTRKSQDSTSIAHSRPR